MKKIVINERDIRKSIRKHLLENEGGETKEVKQRCLTNNVVPLDEIVGKPKDYKNYTSDMYVRDGGVAGMVDALDVLKTLRLHPNVKDGGENIAYNLMNHLNTFRNKNYFDETNGGCLKAMDKVIELYKENEHGEELVKDIEKVLNHQDPTPRAKEYLKRCINLIKEK
jgi:hypothetical protein